MFTVGMICAQWAYLEYLFASAIWVTLNIPHDAGKIVTGGLDMKGRAVMAVRIAEERKKPRDLIAGLATAQKAVLKLLNERNLIVHGTGELRPDGHTYYEVHRGPMRGEPQHVSLIRVHSLASAIDGIVAKLEPVLLKHGIIEMPPQPGSSR
jgi:hypothetical protein